MLALNRKWIGPFTWTFVMIMGGLMITPEGITPIGTNDFLQLALGSTAIALGAIGLGTQWAASTDPDAEPILPGFTIASTAALIIGTIIAFRGLELLSVNGKLKTTLGIILIAIGVMGILTARLGKKSGKNEVEINIKKKV